MARRRTKRGLCPGCLHGIEHHPDKGPCRYAHDPIDPNGRKTLFGGCKCPGFGSKKAAAGTITLSPLEELERLKNAAQAALDALCEHMRVLLLPAADGHANGTTAGTSIETSDEINRLLKVLPARDAIRHALREEDVAPARKKLALPPQPQFEGQRMPPMARRVPSAGVVVESDEPFVMKEMHRKILTALAQHTAGLTKGMILLHADYAQTGHVSKAFAALAREGFMVESEQERDLFRITMEGLRALGPYDKLPVGRALLAHLLQKLNPMDSKLLSVVADAYPAALGKGEILDRAEYSQTGHVSKAFARLKRLRYVTKIGAHQLKLADELAKG